MTVPPFPLSPHTPDPIYSIAGEAHAAGPQAINGTIGMFLEEDGSVAVFPSVRKAVIDVAKNLTTASFGYGSLLGLPAYRRAVTSLIFGKSEHVIASIAATGGTGAVSLNLRLCALLHPTLTALLPTPAWVNYLPLCRATGVTVKEVAHVSDGIASIDDILKALKTTEGPLCVLLQVGCHNPTGLDYSSAQWQTLIHALREREAIALLDFAYQGFHLRPSEDAMPIQRCIEAGVTTLVSWSASKNHSLYSERAGLAAIVVPDEATKVNVEGHYCSLTRGMHSGSATFGQHVVARVQEAYQEEWLSDLNQARIIMRKKRDVLRQTLPDSLKPFVAGNGMFALLPLPKEVIHHLRREESVFFTDSGRINIAGIPLKRMEELGEKIARVL